MPECEASSLNYQENYWSFQLRGLDIPLGLSQSRSTEVFYFSSPLSVSQVHSYIYIPTDSTSDSCLLLWEYKNQFYHSK